MDTFFFSSLVDISKPSIFLVTCQKHGYKIKFCVSTKDDALCYLNEQANVFRQQGLPSIEEITSFDNEEYQTKVVFQRDRLWLRIDEIPRMKDLGGISPHHIRNNIFYCKLKTDSGICRYVYSPFYKDINHAKTIIVDKLVCKITDKTGGAKVTNYIHKAELTSPNPCYPHLSVLRGILHI